MPRERRGSHEPGPCSRGGRSRPPHRRDAGRRGAPARAPHPSSTPARRRARDGGARRGRERRRARRASGPNLAAGRGPGDGPCRVYPTARRMSDPRADFLARSERGGIVPVLREVVLDGDTPLAAFVKVARPPFGFLLESVVGGERWARYTFLGTEPREVWRYRAGSRAVERWTKATGWQGAGETGDRIGHLAQRLRALPAAPVPGLPRFTGGAVGYLGYDLVRTVERLPHPPADTLDLPDAVMMIADTLVILDNLFGRAIVVANVEVPPRAGPAERLRLYDAAEARLDDMIARLGQRHELPPLALRNGLPPLAPESRYPRDAFERDVARVLENVAPGGTFHTGLSRRPGGPGALDPRLPYPYLPALY